MGGDIFIVIIKRTRKKKRKTNTLYKGGNAALIHSSLPIEMILIARNASE
jgi:hypothetical protein